MKIYLFLFTLIGILLSCNPAIPKSTNLKTPIDSLILNWCNTWNHHDSIGVINMFETNAVLIDDNLIANNTSDISKNWIHPNIYIVNNLKASKMQEWATSERAGYLGSDNLDIVVKDSLVAQPKGVFMVNWVKSTDGIWRVTTANIHSFFDRK